MPGTYAPDPSDPTGYGSDLTGLAFVTFDSTSSAKGCPTTRIFVGVANAGSDNIFMTEDAGKTCEMIYMTGYMDSNRGSIQGK